MTTLRILVVSNLYPPNVVGGYERLCFAVASALAGRGHAISVLTSGHGGLVIDIPGQDVDRSLQLLAGATIYQPFPGDAPARDAVNRANLDAFRRAIGTARPDVVFSWNLFFLDRSLLDEMTRDGVKVVAMLTDNWLANLVRPEFVASFFRDHVFGERPWPPAVETAPRPGLLGRFLGRVPLAQAEHPAPLRVPVHAVFGSNFMRVFYDAAGFRFAGHRVVHNGVEQEVPADAGFPDRRASVVPGELRILFAGRLVDLKGAHTAVAALPRLRHPGARLTIVGDEQDAAYMETLRSAIAASGCADRISLRPPVPAAALFDLFAQHDVYVFPSLYEPFSLTLIHAMACGIPTIASRAGGNVEIVEDGISGLLFDKGDVAGLARGLDRLAPDGHLRARLARGGRDSARRFTFAAMIDAMEGFLADVASGP